MKHLRKFNEASVEWTFDADLKSFCDTYLSYLIDEGFEVSIRPWDANYKISIYNYSSFSWNDIKDNFIPFYEVLKNEYNLVYTYDMNIAQTTDESWAVKLEVNSGSICLLDSKLEYVNSDLNVIRSINIIVKQR